VIVSQVFIKAPYCLNYAGCKAVFAFYVFSHLSSIALTMRDVKVIDLLKFIINTIVLP